jgi:hypothetical protein
LITFYTIIVGGFIAKGTNNVLSNIIVHVHHVVIWGTILRVTAILTTPIAINVAHSASVNINSFPRKNKAGKNEKKTNANYRK